MSYEIQIIIGLIGAVSVVCNIIQFLTFTSSNSATKIKKETSDNVTVIMKLEQIGGNVVEIKNNMSSLESNFKEDHDVLIKTVESVKSFHKRMDRIDGGVHVDAERG